MVSANEFSHMLKLDEIGAGISNSAFIRRCQPNAPRWPNAFGLVSLDSLDAELAVSRDTEGHIGRGAFQSSIVAILRSDRRSRCGHNRRTDNRPLRH